MLTLYLVRHGQKQNIPFDPPLSELGYKQAQVTAKHLKDTPFKAIYASPKLRTMQTAEIIAKFHGLPVKTDEVLIERMEWENKETFEEFITEWCKTDLDRSLIPAIGDSSIAKGKKMRNFIDRLSEQYQEGNILIVTHGGAIGDLLRNFFGAGTIEEVIDPVTRAPHILISECSVTIIKNNDGHYSLLRLNDTRHLAEEG